MTQSPETDITKFATHSTNFAAHSVTRMQDDVFDRTKVLTEQEQKNLNKEKINRRITNEKYLRAHPELKLMISRAVEQALLERPDQCNIPSFLQNFFTQPNLKEVVLGNQSK
jgi:hypothetical protein